MTQASEGRKARRRNKVVPLKSKLDLHLTEIERLSLDNCLLRLQVIREEASKRAAGLEAEKGFLMTNIGERLGIPMDAYQVNLNTGAVTPLNGNSEKVAEPLDLPKIEMPKPGSTR